MEAIPSVTSTLFNLSHEAGLLLVLATLSDGGSHPGQPFDVDEETLGLDRDLEWMVDALCCDDELCRLPVRDISLDVGIVVVALDVAVVVLLLERPTLAKRAPNPAKRRGNVVLLLLCWPLPAVRFCVTGLNCMADDSVSFLRSSSAGNESQESRRCAKASDSSDGAAAGDGRLRSSKSSSSSLSSTLCTLSETMPDVVLDDVLLMTEIRWSAFV